MKQALSRIGLIGGGRWSRVLLSVLDDLLPSEREILWVSRHGHDQATSWAKEHASLNLKVRPSESCFDEEGVDALLVASAPQTHAHFVRNALNRRIPVLCEKPVAFQLNEAKELADLSTTTGHPLGVNLVFGYLRCIQEFREHIADSAVRVDAVRILWSDPWCQSRYGEKKYGDIFTAVAHDIVPHVWSILRSIFGGKATSVVGGKYNLDGSVGISMMKGGISVELVVDRRGKERVRLISINQGEAVLDFSSEPGLMEIQGKRLETSRQTPGPLASSLGSFLRVSSGELLEADWDLSLGRCLESVCISASADQLLQKSQQDLLEDLKRSGPLDLENVGLRILLLTIFLPKFASSGVRIPAYTVEEQVEAVRGWQRAGLF